MGRVTLSTNGVRDFACQRLEDRCLLSVSLDRVGALGGEVNDIAVAGAYVYEATSDGLQVVDVSSPLSPALAGSIVTPQAVRKIVVSGSYAYLTGETSDLYVVNVSNAASPVLTATYATAGYIWGIDLAGTLAYLACGSSGIQVIDVSNPASPALKGVCSTPGEAADVKIVGTLAYVADDFSGLQIINVADPASPVLGSAVPLLPASCTPRLIEADGQYAYMVYLIDGISTYGLQVVDISDADAPVMAGTYENLLYAQDLEIEGSHAFVAQRGMGLAVLDISNPAAPQSMATCSTPGDAYGVEVTGSYAYVADYRNGLAVVDVADASHPAVAGTFAKPRYLEGVAVSGNYAYLADGPVGLQIVNISDPAHPLLSATYRSTDWPTSVLVVGSYAYVVGSSIEILDVSNPLAPTRLGKLSLGSAGLDIALGGSYVYIADGLGGLKIVDVSNPSAPSLTASYAMPHYPLRIAISGVYAYVIDTAGQIQITDISNPASPSLLQTYEGIDGAQDIEIIGSLAYVACGSGGLKILSLSNPLSPTLLGTVLPQDAALGESARRVTVDDGYAYVTASYALNDNLALLAIDVNNPVSPTLVAKSTVRDTTAMPVAVKDSYVYGADGYRGLEIFDLRQVPNVAPVALSISASAVAEHRAAGTTVGVFSATDPNTGDTFTYSLVAGTGSADNAAFTIQDGRLKTRWGFDYEGKRSYSVRVRATDQDGLFVEQAFTIAITNVVESGAKALVISGTSRNDTISLSMVGDKLRLTMNGKRTDYSAAKISSLTINAMGGADRVTIGAGVRPVKIYGGDGNDSLSGGENADYLDGGNGNDVLSGGDGNDKLYGQAGADKLYGGSGADKLYGGAGVDYLYGQDGDDELFAIDRTTDHLSGGNGSDKAHWDSAKDHRIDRIESLLKS